MTYTSTLVLWNFLPYEVVSVPSLTTRAAFKCCIMHGAHTIHCASKATYEQYIIVACMC